MTAKAVNDKTPTGVSSVYPPVLLLIAVALLIYWAYGYGETARQLPVLVGTGTLILIVLDIISRLRGKVGVVIRSSLGAGFQDREMDFNPRLQSEIIQLAWIVACVVSILFVGILPTVPMFIFLYLVIQGKRSFIFSVIVSLHVLLLVGLVFEVLLDYELYRGHQFGQDGFE